MKLAETGRPSGGPIARTLGVRIPADIRTGARGIVGPGTGGMSVTPDDPLLLPRYGRPPNLAGGIGKDPVWEMREDRLGDGLGFRSVPRNPREHGFVMLLVARRVVSTAHKVQGVNACRYHHRLESWPFDPRSMFEDPNKSMGRRSVQLRPGGNRVIDFL